MTNIAGMTLCAKRGGPSFIETIRVDTSTLKCPEGTVPCSQKSDASNTVCMAPSELEQCPILDIMVIYSQDIE